MYSYCNKVNIRFKDWRDLKCTPLFFQFRVQSLYFRFLLDKSLGLIQMENNLTYGWGNSLPFRGPIYFWIKMIAFTFEDSQSLCNSLTLWSDSGIWEVTEIPQPLSQKRLMEHTDFNSLTLNHVCIQLGRIWRTRLWSEFVTEDFRLKLWI